MEIASIEKKRKQHFAFLCIALSSPAILGFTIVDFIEGETMEFIIDISICLVFAFALVALKKRSAHLPIYRLGLALLSLFYIYNVSIGAGEGTVIYFLFPFPLVFVFFLGKTEGVIVATAFFCVLWILLINPFSLKIYAYSVAVSLRFLVSLLLVTVMSYALEASRNEFGRLLIEKHAKLLEEKQQLQQALGEIKTLNGLIPICSNCKKIRNDEGYWQQVEVYVRDHTHANFSHGICPDCAGKLYPDYKGLQRFRGEIDNNERTGRQLTDSSG